MIWATPFLSKIMMIGQLVSHSGLKNFEKIWQKFQTQAKADAIIIEKMALL